jgi:hypothetical protein
VFLTVVPAALVAAGLVTSTDLLFDQRFPADDHEQTPHFLLPKLLDSLRRDAEGSIHIAVAARRSMISDAGTALAEPL